MQEYANNQSNTSVSSFPPQIHVQVTHNVVPKQVDKRERNEWSKDEDTLFLQGKMNSIFSY